MTLFANEVAQISVLIDKNATEQEKYAAQEIVHYLSLMGSVSIPLVTVASGSVISINHTNDFGDDGFAIKTAGDCVAIIGGVRGVIYGAYEFLERLGCRFFTPLCEKIPSTKTLTAPNFDITQIPTLEYRQHNYTDIVNRPRFSAKMRLNAGALPKYLGGGIQYAWFVHTFDRNILDPEEWFDGHPEYFSMVNGERKKEFSQLCLTNPDVMRITIKKAAQALREHPECRIISISQNDWYSQCECPACAAIDNEEGSCMGSLLRFVNAVAEALEPEFPQAIIDTLAYQYSRPAPKITRPRHNVCVRLCTIEACFAHSFDACDDVKRKVARPDGSTGGFIEDLRDWGKICNRMYIWDYTTGFAHYPAPHPNFNVLKPNMQAFVQNGVKGVFEQACGARGGSSDMNELRAYVISKLLWDANTDVDRHILEFTDEFYGAAGAHIRKYIKLITDTVEKENIHVGFNDPCDNPHLRDEMLNKYDAILKDALNAVMGDAIRMMRVEKVRLSIRWVRMKNAAMRGEQHNPDEINQFFTDWRAHGMTRIDEWVSAETTHRALIENRRRGVEYYHHWTDEGPERM